MARNTIEMRQERLKLIEELRQIHEGTIERGQKTAEERDKMEKLEAAIKGFDELIESEERIQKMEADAAKSQLEGRQNGNGDGKQWTGIHYPVRGSTRTPSLSVVDTHATNFMQAWLRSSKENPKIEQEHRDAAEFLGQDFRNRQVFIPLIKNYRHFQKEHRALDVATSNKGQETIPEGFVRSLDEAMLTFGGMRLVSEVVRTDGVGDLPWPTVNDTGNSAVILDEATDFGASVDPSFGAVIFKAFKYSSKPILISTELLQDSAFDLGARIGEMLGIRIARGQNAHFSTGGGTTLPKGILVAGTSFAAADDLTISADDIIGLEHSVDPAYRPNARFMMHDNILAAVRKLKESTTNAYIWQPGLQAGVPDRLLGYPYTINQQFPSALAASAKVMAFGDFSKYKIRDVATLRLIRLDELYAATDQVGFIAYMRSDGNLVDAGTHPVKYLQLLAS